MNVLVTGATGFIGANIVRQLLKGGHKVRALVREKSDQRNIRGLNLDVAYGNLLDRESLESAIEGCDGLIHSAAYYTFWSSNPKEVYDTNVQGTRNILEAARDRQIRRVVFTSSESTIGIAQNSGIGSEEIEVATRDLSGHYKRSKFESEKIALGMCKEGLPVVVVNPSVPIGPWDVKPTPTGQFIVDFLRGKMPAYVNAGLNVVDVEDVAVGHVLALEKGKVGERYILGNRNVTFKDVLFILERITGIKAPWIRIPLWLALGAGYIDEFVSSKIGKRHPRIAVESVRAACRCRHFDCSKAANDLGVPQSPIESACEKAVTWFRENGYA